MSQNVSKYLFAQVESCQMGKPGTKSGHIVTQSLSLQGSETTGLMQNVIENMKPTPSTKVLLPFHKQEQGKTCTPLGLQSNKHAMPDSFFFFYSSNKSFINSSQKKKSINAAANCKRSLSHKQNKTKQTRGNQMFFFLNGQKPNIRGFGVQRAFPLLSSVNAHQLLLPPLHAASDGCESPDPRGPAVIMMPSYDTMLFYLF